MNSYIPGEWNVICDRCGFKRKSSQVVKTWDNFIVCSPIIKSGCFETRHPQDFVRAVKDDQTVPFVRREPAEVFTNVAVNCDVYEDVWIGSPITADLVIFKGISRGPVEVDAVVTVHCTWTIT